MLGNQNSLTHSLSQWQGHLLSCPGQLKRWYFWTPLFDIIEGWAGPAYLATSQLINYALYRRRHSAKCPSKNHNNKEMAFWCWSHWAFFSVFGQIQIQWSMGRPLGPKTQIRSQGMTNKVSDHQRDNLSLLQLSSHFFSLGSVLPSEWFIILMRNAVGKTNSL